MASTWLSPAAARVSSASARSTGPGQAAVEGAPGDFVSLLGLDTVVEGVTTEGLRFALVDESLPVGPSRGLSNELTTGHAR